MESQEIIEAAKKRGAEYRVLQNSERQQRHGGSTLDKHYNGVPGSVACRVRRFGKPYAERARGASRDKSLE